MKLRIALIGLVALALSSAGGCSKRSRIEIQSDVCWNGTVNNDAAINSCGNAIYKVAGPLTCVRLQKQSTTGFLRVRIDGGAWSETTDAFGVVQACH